MDEKNREILRELERDGRIPNLTLAERVGLSPSATSRRVAELERSGVISGYRAIVDRARINRGFVVLVAVGLNEHSKKSQQAFERAMNRAYEVRECHNIAGAFEYLIRVETRDLASYKVFHTEVLGTVPQVNSITSYIVLDSTKDERC